MKEGKVSFVIHFLRRVNNWIESVREARYYHSLFCRLFILINYPFPLFFPFTFPVSLYQFSFSIPGLIDRKWRNKWKWGRSHNLSETFNRFTCYWKTYCIDLIYVYTFICSLISCISIIIKTFRRFHGFFTYMYGLFLCLLHHYLSRPSPLSLSPVPHSTLSFSLYLFRIISIQFPLVIYLVYSIWSYLSLYLSTH